jgi:hypothetical protein
MTIYNRGSWANGCVHTVIDDKWRKPEGHSIMAFFLKMTEDELTKALDIETREGTLTQKQACAIITGYVKKKPTYNAYEGGE